ncbi:MAG: AbrB/MazE/SpoVT family DNA-binding domain-containing protein, partial [Candidatus Sericytochromatia bacterium]|nr:AbrB/MazE/SpoVT family DNA-binding domain-containing protein [Candidatus Tanganyikabacteria bacterium]
MGFMAEQENKEGTFRIQLGDKGRLIIPIALRRATGLKAGDRLLAKVEPDGTIRIEKAPSTGTALLGLFKHLAIPGRSVVDEFIEEK